MKATIAACLLLLAATRTVIASDLVVDGTTHVINSPTAVHGNVWVQNGGRLEIRGTPGNPTTLTMHLGFDEEFHIDVSDTSVMVVDNGVITTPGDYQYWMELSGNARLEVSGDDSWITFHSGIRPFDNAQVIVTGGDVEELQARDNVSVTLSDAATYPVYFFDGDTASLSGLHTDESHTISNTVSVPGGWSFSITNGWVEGYQIDLKHGAEITVDDSDGIVLSIHTPGDLGPDLRIAENLTSSDRSDGATTNLGSSFTFTDSNIALVNAYVFGSDRVLLRDMHVNEVNAEQESLLIIGQKGHATTLNCNLCQVYDDARFVAVDSTIDNRDNVPSATSSYADFEPVGRGVMRFVNMDLNDLYLTTREEGTLELYNSPHDPAKLNQIGTSAVLDIRGFDADFVADRITGEAPLDVQFFDHSAGTITSHAWSFDDGGSSSSGEPSHLFGAVGRYTISLTASGPGGPDTIVRTDYVEVGMAVFNDDFESGTTDAWTAALP